MYQIGVSDLRGLQEGQFKNPTDNMSVGADFFFPSSENLSNEIYDELPSRT
jgi:hypothetical protein